MKKFYFFLFFALFLSAKLFCQPSFIWAKAVSGASATNQPNGIAVDASGNVYTVGSFTGTMDFDPGPSTFTMSDAGSGDIYITKFDASGNFVWARRIGAGCDDEGNAIVVDGAGDVLITGSFCGTVDFEPGPNVINMSAMNVDYFVCKINGNSGFGMWATQIVSGLNEYGYGVAVDNNNNVLVTGSFMGGDFDAGPGTYTVPVNGGMDIFVCKYTSGGVITWAGAMGGGSNDYGYGISVDGSGNVLTTGQYASTGDFDPGAGVSNLTAVGGNDIFVSKLSSAGAFVWAKSLGGTVNDIGIGIKADASGNVLTTGSFNGTGDFDPGVGSFSMTSAGSNDAFISKLDASGNFSWAKQFGASGVDGGSGISSDASGNVYTTGYFSNTVDFDPGPGTFNLSSAGLFDVFISKLDASGNFGWAVKMGSSGGEMSNGIFVDANTLIYTTGNFQNTVDFDPGAGVSNLTSLGSSDIFVQKLSTCTLTPVQPGAISGPSVMCAGAGAQTYSIAVVGGASGYVWSLPGGWSGTSSTNTISATPGSTGIFSVAATNSCGTGPSQTVNVTVNPAPNVTATGPGTVCSGNMACLTGSGALSYTWTGLCGFNSFSQSPCIPLTQGCSCGFTLAGTDANGCSKTVTLCVPTIPQPTVNASSSNTQICAGQSATLTASGASNYSWTPGGTGSVIVVSPTINTSYSVVGTTTNGCQGADSLFIVVSPCTGIHAASAAMAGIKVYPSPFRSFLTVTKSGKEKSLISIYNSLGKLLYSEEMTEEEKTLQLEQAPVGIYLVKIESLSNTYIFKVLKE
jgi:hypothetical protein